MKAMHLLVATVLLLVACSGKSDKADQAPAAEQGMSGMSMDSMQMDRSMGMGGMKMMPMMRAHMDSIAGMSPAQMTRTMARHQRMMSQMMDQMGGDMRQMKMAGSAEWNALTDSVKADLADLPGLQGQELAQTMRAHANRVRRLIASHEQMLKGMK
jgi:hypothetical protein